MLGVVTFGLFASAGLAGIVIGLLVFVSHVRICMESWCDARDVVMLILDAVFVAGMGLVLLVSLNVLAGLV